MLMVTVKLINILIAHIKRKKWVYFLIYLSFAQRTSLVYKLSRIKAVQSIQFGVTTLPGLISEA
jgi:hypothetical protein